MAEPGAAVVCGCEALPSSAKNGLLDSCGFITAMQPDCFDANGLGRCCWCGSLLSALVSVGTVPTLRAQIHRFLLVRDIFNTPRPVSKLSHRPICGTTVGALFGELVKPR